jgi:hypothetical protein
MTDQQEWVECPRLTPEVARMLPEAFRRAYRTLPDRYKMMTAPEIAAELLASGVKITDNEWLLRMRMWSAIQDALVDGFGKPVKTKDLLKETFTPWWFTAAAKGPKAPWILCPVPMGDVRDTKFLELANQRILEVLSIPMVDPRTGRPLDDIKLMSLVMKMVIAVQDRILGTPVKRQAIVQQVTNTNVKAPVQLDPDKLDRRIAEMEGAVRALPGMEAEYCDAGEDEDD